jgi:hypothetical protein
MISIIRFWWGDRIHMEAFSKDVKEEINMKMNSWSNKTIWSKHKSKTSEILHKMFLKYIADTHFGDNKEEK